MVPVKYNDGQVRERNAMRVIFYEDVPGVGRAGEIKEVKDGYGRNYLIPRKLAAPAVAGSVHSLKTKLATQARIEAKTEAEMKDLAAMMEGREVFIEARSGGRERLYGSVTNADIASALEELTGFAVDKRKVRLDEPINQLGSYEVTIRLAKDIVPKVKVTVTEKSE